MATGRLREIQPAHKSKNVTVRQAEQAWLKVEGKKASTGAASPKREVKEQSASRAAEKATSAKGSAKSAKGRNTVAKKSS